MKHRVLISAGGRSEWLDIDAESAGVASAKAARSGARVLRVELVEAAPAPLRVSWSRTIFLQETLTLLKAGLNVVEAIEALERKEVNPGFRQVLGRVLLALREGASFSDALLREPALFPQVLVAGVAASETTGGLASTLERYLAYDARINQIKRKVSASAIYPLLLMGVGGSVILFLIAYVLPKFSAILDGSGRHTGPMTLLLIHFGQAIQQHPLAFAAVLLGLGAGAAWLVFNDTGRRLALTYLMRIPVLSGIFGTLGLSRLYRTLALLLVSGIPLLQALEMARGIVNPLQSAELATAIGRLRSGQPLTEALGGSSLIPPIAESLLRVGERSGALADMADKLADFLDIALDRRVDMFSRLFEPLLMSFIGVVIGAIVLMMYSPIFDLVGSVGQ
ncbi:type II secretion system F family protein [Rhodanobacter thiooxydans]|uniref:type II secretion system F family protein n=1 Tax=Rhodanobacter thiooxydans TaxID=416169 RepID=UPI000260EFB3|nr:type II secretion system F family protein [Rhodanobacter thiooxydans]EIL98064.1 type II secretion system F domain protein [Rhodanobacter thiooxydans LCS2]